MIRRFDNSCQMYNNCESFLTEHFESLSRAFLASFVQNGSSSAVLHSFAMELGRAEGLRHGNPSRLYATPISPEQAEVADDS